MAGTTTTMFGKAYDTVGSADKNLILQTRGDLKVRWGNKYIDLIKNGKINVDVDLLKKIDNKDSIIKDGIYLVENEDHSEVWLQIGNSLINLLGEIGTTYVSYVGIQEVTVDEKFTALSNIGFFYQTLEDVKKASVQKGLVYIIDQHKLFYVEGGEITEYIPSFTIPDPLRVGSVTIDGKGQTINGTNKLLLNLSNKTYLSILEDKIQVSSDIVTESALMSEDYHQGKTGYSIYFDEEKNWYCAEFDYIKVRRILEYGDIIDIRYKDLRELISTGTLIPKMHYRIIDFQNEWDINGTEVYEDHEDSNGVIYQQNIFPIIVTAKTLSQLEKEGYIEGHPEWIIEYDPDFYHYIDDYTDDKGIVSHLYTKGRITKLSDEHGNIANYDFKHRMFKHDSGSDDINNWYFTFNTANLDRGTFTTRTYDSRNTRLYRDATQEQNTQIKNNIIYLNEPKLIDIDITINGVLTTVKQYIKDTDYIIFKNCSLHIPYDNVINNVIGVYEVLMEFTENSIAALIQNEKLLYPYLINYEFIKNTSGNIYITGNVTTIVNTPVEFDYTSKHIIFTQNKTYSENIFKNVENTEFKKNLTKNTFENIIDCIIDAPLENNIFNNDLKKLSLECVEMKNNHFVGVINTNDDINSYTIKVNVFNDNIVGDIIETKIDTTGNITNNDIGKIQKYTLKNVTLTNNLIQGIIYQTYEGILNKLEETTITDSIFENIYGCDSMSTTISNCWFYDVDLNIYYSVYRCVFRNVSIIKSIFTCNVWNTDFYGNVSSSHFYKEINGGVAKNKLGVISDCNFYKEITKIDAEVATFNTCEFNDIINDAVFTGTLTKCKFEGLSNGIKINGPLYNMTIQVNITPNSAQWVQQLLNPSLLTSILELIIDTTTIPRLQETSHKECFIKTINDNGTNKVVFFVQLSTDDNTPSGVIVMWSGLITDIPKGYALCDGTNGTPNLSGKFIRSAENQADIGVHINPDLIDDGAGTRAGYIQIHDYNLPSHVHIFDQVTISDNIRITGNTDSANANYYYETITTSSDTITTGGEGSATVYNASSNGHNDYSSHSHGIDITVPISLSFTPIQQTDTFTNTKIFIEPNAYALAFIMKL